MTTVREVVLTHLKSIGADGLCSESCGCGVNDLMPCDSCFFDCYVARKTIAKNDGDFYEKGDTIYVPMEAKE